MKKPKIVMLGICSQCGDILVRPPPADAAVCDCSSLVEVPLTEVPTDKIQLRLPFDLHRKLKALAKRRKLNLNETFIYAMMHEGVEAVLNK